MRYLLPGSLRRYWTGQHETVTLVDTSVLLDALQDDPKRAASSQGRLESAAPTDRLAINPVSYSELSVAFERIEELEQVVALQLAKDANMAQDASQPLERSSFSTREPARRTPRKLHIYFIVFSLVFAAIVLAGFSRTFFIPVVRGTFSKPLVVRIHGALFFAWTALLVSQSILAATKRLGAHRKVGLIAGWLVLPMLALGTLVAVRDTIHDYRAGEGDAALAFFYGELADLAMFGLLAGAAMLLRSKPDFHKRWVLLGSLGLIGAAVGRIPELSGFFLCIFLGLIASMAIYDLSSRRSIHAATAIGAAVLLTLGLSEEFIGNTQAWLSAAHYMLGV